MAIVKLNKLQCMPENMSQLLSNKTHMPKNLYQTSSENSYSGLVDVGFCGGVDVLRHFGAKLLSLRVFLDPVNDLFLPPHKIRIFFDQVTTPFPFP